MSTKNLDWWLRERLGPMEENKRKRRNREISRYQDLENESIEQHRYNDADMYRRLAKIERSQ